MKLRKVIFYLCLLNSALLSQNDAWALDCEEGNCFSELRRIGGEVVPLRGTSTFRYLGFTVYDAAFYSPKSSDPLAPQIKELELVYHRNISAKDLCRSTKDVMEENPLWTQVKIDNELKTLCDSYKDISPGDRYTLRYIPTVGSTLFFNGVEQVTIPGDVFHKLYFGIWISDHSVGRSFTKGLLGGS